MKFDEFESVFRSAIKERYSYSPPDVGAVVVVIDRDRQVAEGMVAELRELNSGLSRIGEVSWHTVCVDDFAGIAPLLGRVQELQAGLVVTWRNVFGLADDSSFALGSVVETLSQALDVPVLVMPGEGAERRLPARQQVDSVLVVTDHLTGARRLIDWGLLLTPDQGTIYLAHIEDQATFERYMDAIGRIPSMDTDVARDRLAAKLLQLPSDYIESVVTEMASCGISETVVPIVRMGDPLGEYESLVAESEIDLVLVHSKDASQRAMEGTAYALTVELADTPVLML